MLGLKFSDPSTPSGGPLSISGPLGLNPRLSPQVLDGHSHEITALRTALLALLDPSMTHVAPSVFSAQLTADRWC